MKNNFSSGADSYSTYRPYYPPELFEFIASLVSNRNLAWDCGTGNGQIAIQLANFFEKVYATDISVSQIENAPEKDNVFYSVQPAEKTDFNPSTFDLIVVAQAIHWFDFEKFYQECIRTSKKEGWLCVVGYSRVQVNPQIDGIVDDLYFNTLGQFWDAERKYIDDGYKTIPFPFPEVEAPLFMNKMSWSAEHFLCYLNTWSAVKKFINLQGYDPIEEIRESVIKEWGRQNEREVAFPLLLRMGKIHGS